MNKVLFVLVLAYPFLGNSQTMQQQEKGSNTTAERIEIPGTGISVIPPLGFFASKQKQALQTHSGNAMYATVYDKSNFYKMAEMMNQSSFEEQGVEMLESKEIKISNFPAKYSLVRTKTGHGAQFLFFGDSTFAVVIKTIFSGNDTAIQRALFNSFATIQYARLKPQLPQDAGFVLDDKLSIFKYAEQVDKTYYYFIKGKYNPDDIKQPFIMVSFVPANSLIKLESMATLLDKLDIIKYELDNVQKKDSTFFRINGYEAYRSESYGTIKGNKTLLFSTLIRKGDKGFVIRGIARKDFETSLAEFKKIIATIQIQ